LKYIGNFIDKVPAGLIETLLAEDGEITPVYQPDKWQGSIEIEAALKQVEDAGYPALDYSFHQYTDNTVCMQPFVNDLKWLSLTNIVPKQFNQHHWWIVKYNPGDMQPMHVDPHVRNASECMRYTMMLTDFAEGHILTHDDFMLTDYKAGDLFLWEDYYCYHGAVNIGYTPRISLQVSFYNK
jgi:hypothetical protein